MVCLNQTRVKIGVMYGDPTTTPGGMAIPFHSSVRIKLGAGQQIVNKDKDVIGIHVSAKTIKNKVSPPFRKVEFEIHFGKGIREHEQIFDVLRKHGDVIHGGRVFSVEGTGAWKSISVVDKKTGEVLKTQKFYKADFDKIIASEEFKDCIDIMIHAIMNNSLVDEPDIDPESYSEIQSLVSELDAP